MRPITIDNFDAPEADEYMTLVQAMLESDLQSTIESRGESDTGDRESPTPACRSSLWPNANRDEVIIKCDDHFKRRGEVAMSSQRQSGRIVTSPSHLAPFRNSHWSKSTETPLPKTRVENPKGVTRWLGRYDQHVDRLVELMRETTASFHYKEDSEVSTDPKLHMNAVRPPALRCTGNADGTAYASELSGDTIAAAHIGGLNSAQNGAYSIPQKSPNRRARILRWLWRVRCENFLQGHAEVVATRRFP
jgi:hypothetical protein